MTKERKCPHCKRGIGDQTGVGHDSDPVPGSLSVCAYCAAPLIFGENLELNLLDKDDFDKLDPKAQNGLLKAIVIVRRMILEQSQQN